MASTPSNQQWQDDIAYIREFFGALLMMANLSLLDCKLFDHPEVIVDDIDKNMATHFIANRIVAYNRVADAGEDLFRNFKDDYEVLDPRCLLGCLERYH